MKAFSRYSIFKVSIQRGEFLQVHSLILNTELILLLDDANGFKIYVSLG